MPVFPELPERGGAVSESCCYADLLSRWVSCGATKKVKRCMYFTTVCGWLYVRTLFDQPLMSVARFTFRCISVR